MSEGMAQRTKYDLIMEAIESLSRQNTGMIERVEQHHRTLYGNGQEGICEMVRTIKRDVAALPTKQDMGALREEVIQSKASGGVIAGSDDAGSDAITFRWLLEKVFVPILWPLLVVLAGAAYIIQNYAK